MAQTAAERAAVTRRRDLQRKYGITPEQYDAILALQGGVCAICLKPPTTRRFAVDHQHKTKTQPAITRGLLCTFCNGHILGRGREDPAKHQRAADYLLDPPAQRVLGAGQ